MTRIGGWSWKFSRLTLLFMICLGLVSVFLLPGLGRADYFSDGTVTIHWANATITATTGIGGTGSAVALNWFDQTVADTRGSFSSVSTGLNAQLDIYNPQAIDYVDGAPWSNTAASFASSSLTGNARTYSSPIPSYDPSSPLPANQIYANSNLVMTGSNTGAILTQAVLLGQFTVPSAAYFTISAPFTFSQSLSSSGPLPNYSQLIAAIILSDFNGFDPNTANGEPVLASDVQSMSNTGNFGPITAGGTLNITNFLLDPTVTYDFEASATASGTVAPIPSSLLLLGSGMIGLIVRKVCEKRPFTRNQ